jgi:hypothetical protein
MWQRSQNLHATQTESQTQNKHMTAVGYISDTEKIVKAYLSLFLHDGIAIFKLSERYLWPPALSAKDLPGGQINQYPVESDEASAPESISQIDHCLNWNGDLDNPNDSEDDWATDVESAM